MTTKHVYEEGTGLCVLICNYEFGNFLRKLSQSGIEKDGDNMQKTMAAYGYEIHGGTFNLNLNLSETQQLFNEVLRPPKVYSSLVIYITSHGKNGEIAATDQFWNIEELLHMFNARACGAWKDKPKIFIFDACQGDRIDEGEKGETVIDNPYVKPIWRDFLIIHSSYMECKSRVLRDGSIFTTQLVKVLNESTRTLDLISHLTFVNNNVSKRLNRGFKQMPYFRSTLIKFVLFRKKEQTDESPMDGHKSVSETSASMDIDVTDGQSDSLRNMLQNLPNLQMKDEMHEKAEAIFAYFRENNYTEEQLLDLGVLMNHQSLQYFSKKCLSKENIIDFLKHAYNQRNSDLEKEAYTFIEHNYADLEETICAYLDANNGKFEADLNNRMLKIQERLTGSS